MTVSVEDSSSKTSVDGFICVMLERLHKLKLHPSPVPQKVAEAFNHIPQSLSQTCSTCEATSNVSAVPDVEFNLKDKTARLLGHKGICAKCHEVYDLKTLNNHVAKAIMTRKKDDFDKVYRHFLEINQIKNQQSTTLQEVMSIANSLQLIYAEIPWEFVTG